MPEQIGLAKSAESVEPSKPIVHKDLDTPAISVDIPKVSPKAPYEFYANINVDPFRATDMEKQWVEEIYNYATDQVPESQRTIGNIMYKVAEIKSRFSAGERNLVKIYEWIKLSKQSELLKKQREIDFKIQDIDKRKEALSV